MNVEKIGINAGVVWKALEGSKDLSTKDLKKETKLTEKDLSYALGWLAREGKVNFSENEKDVYVHLS
ncbi:MAG: winged helix-turn-helix domain-containing protein [Prevotellaceae bacterium]|jgi:hypothetical protein|nr:winged helix-turn-helix domain-containing protein [Prevotellaceae bacterium]